MALAANTVKVSTNAYRAAPSDFVARRVFPPCKLQGGLYDPETGRVSAVARRVTPYANMNIGKANFAHTPGSKITRVRSKFQDYNLNIERTMLEVAIDEDAYNALPDSIGPTAKAQIVEPLGNLLRLQEERKFAAALTGASWGGSFTGSGTNRWSNASFNALENIQDGVSDFIPRAGGMRPNKFVMSLDYWQALINNPYIQALWGANYQTLTLKAVRERLADALMGPFGQDGDAAPFEIVVALATQNTANTPDTNSTLSYVLNSYAALLYSPPVSPGVSVAMEEISSGKTYWHELLSVEQYAAKDTNEIVFKAKEHTEPSTFDTNLGYSFSSMTT